MNSISMTYYTTKKYVCCLLSLKTSDDMFEMAAYTLSLSEDGFQCHEAYYNTREDTIDTTIMQEDELFQESLVWDKKYSCDFDKFCKVQSKMRELFDDYPVKRFSTKAEQYKRKIVYFD